MHRQAVCCARTARLTLLGRAATDVGLDRIESTDAHERLRRDRRRGRRLDLIEAPPHMAPAKGEDDIAALGETGRGAIAVDLQGALEARKVNDRPFSEPRSISATCRGRESVWSGLVGYEERPGCDDSCSRRGTS